MSNNYRQSHSTQGYGELYTKSYTSGYNHFQWEFCEKPLLQNLFTKLNSRFNDASCLDFACGTGRITELAESIFNRTTGVDISKTMLEQAAQSTNNSTLINRDITSEPLDNKFDVISAFRFFNNAEPCLRRDVLLALRENMHDTSVLIFNIHRNAQGFLSIYYAARNLNAGQTTTVNDQNRSTFCHLDEIRTLLDETGYAINSVHWYCLLPKSSRYPDWLLKFAFKQLEALWSRIPQVLRKNSQCFLVSASKIPQ